MTSKERVLLREQHRAIHEGKAQGKADALDLAARAPGMDGTGIIAEEDHIPVWSKLAVYTQQHIGFPVRDGDQVYTLLMPHTPANNPGLRPAELPSVYGLLHTTDPAKAKPWVASSGTSGLYREEECCLFSGKVWRNLYDGNAYPPLTQGAEERWEEVPL